MSSKFQAIRTLTSSKGKENQHQFSSSFQVLPPASFWSVAKMTALQGRDESSTAIPLHELRHDYAISSECPRASLAPCLENWVHSQTSVSGGGGGCRATNPLFRIFFGMWREHTDALRVLMSSHSLPLKMLFDSMKKIKKAHLRNRWRNSYIFSSSSSKKPRI